MTLASSKTTPPPKKRSLSPPKPLDGGHPYDPFVRLAGTLDAIFELAVSLGQLLGHVRRPRNHD
jgi:hypothetical protein